MRRKSAIVVLYTLVGPAIGAVVTIIALIAYGALSDVHALRQEFAEQGPGVLFALPLMLFYGVPVSYYTGGLQALLCGLLLAAISDLDGRFTYAQAAFAAAVTSLVSAAFIIGVLHAGAEAALFLVAAGVPASLIVRFLFREKMAPVFEIRENRIAANA